MGRAKGLLPVPPEPKSERANRAGASGSTILEHLVQTCQHADLGPRYLVGERRPYTELLTRGALADAPGLLMLDDAPAGIGPLGGLRALLHATDDAVVLIACDMPFITVEHLRALRRAATEHPEAAIITPGSAETGAHFQSMLSVYRAPLVRRAVDTMVDERTHALRRLPLHPELGGPVVRIPDAPFRRALVDWDTPADIAASQSGWDDNEA